MTPLMNWFNVGNTLLIVGILALVVAIGFVWWERGKLAKAAADKSVASAVSPPIAVAPHNPLNWLHDTAAANNLNVQPITSISGATAVDTSVREPIRVEPLIEPVAPDVGVTNGVVGFVAAERARIKVQMDLLAARGTALDAIESAIQKLS